MPEDRDRSARSARACSYQLSISERPAAQEYLKARFTPQQAEDTSAQAKIHGNRHEDQSKVPRSGRARANLGTGPQEAAKRTGRRPGSPHSKQKTPPRAPVSTGIVTKTSQTYCLQEAQVPIWERTANKAKTNGRSPGSPQSKQKISRAPIVERNRREVQSKVLHSVRACAILGTAP